MAVKQNKTMFGDFYFLANLKYDNNVIMEFTITPAIDNEIFDDILTNPNELTYFGYGQIYRFLQNLGHSI